MSGVHSSENARSTEAMPLLSVCVITHNQAPFIRQSVESALPQEVSLPWDLIIADHCSHDGTREILSSRGCA
jgi:glycosyltransferase involved in cell wall biosynthesis